MKRAWGSEQGESMVEYVLAVAIVCVVVIAVVYTTGPAIAHLLGH